jgi:hypothetical protein
MYNYGGGFFCTVLDNINNIHVNQRGEMIFCCDIKDPFGKIGVITKNNIKELIIKKQAITNKIRTDRLVKLVNQNLNEIEEHTCEYCNRYFKKK